MSWELDFGNAAHAGFRPTRHESYAPPNDFRPFEVKDAEQSVAARFEAVVGRVTGVAVKTPTASISYEEVNRKANRIARTMLERALPPNTPIACFFDDDVKHIGAMLGVLKCAHLFVTLDPGHPVARNAELLQDAQVCLVLTDARNRAMAENLAGGMEILDIDAIPAGVCDENPRIQIAPSCLACIAYTSGSTGQPKGVLYNQRNLLGAAMRMTNGMRITPADRITLFSARSAAQALVIIFSALLNGATICPFRPKEEGLDRVAAWMMAERITIYYSIPSIFYHFARTLSGTERFSHLRMLRLGGEPVYRRHFELFKNHFPGTCVFMNALASSEAAGPFRQYSANRETVLEESLVPAGHSIPGMEVLLLDDGGQPIPARPGVDMVGEIAIRSRFLAIGYWRRPEQTKAAFMTDPADADVRIYRTGDLGRMTPDGCLYHLGRKDFQIKIRGNRVEPAEIEMALLEIPDVGQAAVVARPDKQGEMSLVAYLVPENGRTPERSALRKALRDRLPDYMIPSEFVTLKEFPLTLQGKLDRKALPEPEVHRNHVAPRNQVEGHLAVIWEDILGVRPIGVQDDFFDVGGNSLSAARVINYIESDFGERLPISTFFTASTVEELAKLMPKADHTGPASALTKIQEGQGGRPFFFVHGQYNGGGFYCRRLAPLLGADRSFYALQPLGPQDHSLPPSIEAMAASYVGLVRSVQPHGPYVLGGYCNGGLIAFEMAQQLRVAGETVALVAIIDIDAKNTQFRLQHKMAALLRLVAGLDPAKEIDCFIRLRHLTIRADEMSPGQIRVSALRKLYRLRVSEVARLLHGIARLRKQRDSAAVHCGSALADDPRWEDRTPHYHRIVTSYVPQPYPGRIVLFRAHDSEKPAEAATMGWQNVTSSLEVNVIPGGHSTCVTEPENLAVFASQLKTYLDGCLGESHV